MATNYSIDPELVHNALSTWKVVSDSTNTVRFHIADSRSSYRVVKTKHGHYLSLEIKNGGRFGGINTDEVWFENQAVMDEYMLCLKGLANDGLDEIFAEK